MSAAKGEVRNGVGERGDSQGQQVRQLRSKAAEDVRLKLVARSWRRHWTAERKGLGKEGSEMSAKKNGKADQDTGCPTLQNLELLARLSYLRLVT